MGPKSLFTADSRRVENISRRVETFQRAIKISPFYSRRVEKHSRRVEKHSRRVENPAQDTIHPCTKFQICPCFGSHYLRLHFSPNPTCWLLVFVRKRGKRTRKRSFIISKSQRRNHHNFWKGDQRKELGGIIWENIFLSLFYFELY